MRLRPVRIIHALASSILVTLAGACGYRPVAVAPLASRSAVFVASPLLAPGIAAVELGPTLRRALGQQLARRGVRLASRRRPGVAVLGCRVVALSQARVTIGADGVRATTPRLRVDLWLVDGARGTIWRTGYVEADQPRSLPGETLRADEARRWALTRLAGRVAALGVERLIDAAR